ncbi:glycosyl transferase, partial [Rhizobium leguminosarum]
YRGISFDRKMLYKYMSIRARIEHAIEKDGSNPRVHGLLVGDYAV